MFNKYLKKSEVSIQLFLIVLSTILIYLYGVFTYEFITNFIRSFNVMFDSNFIFVSALTFFLFLCHLLYMVFIYQRKLKVEKTKNKLIRVLWIYMFKAIKI